MTGQAQISWTTGGEAWIVAIGADAVTLESTTPAPPGARVEGVLLASPGSKLRVKVRATRREASGRFRIDGRPIDLTREVRAALLGLMGEESAPR